MQPVPLNGSLPISIPPDDGIDTYDNDADRHHSAAKEDYMTDDDNFGPQKFYQAVSNNSILEIYLYQKIKQNSWHKE